MALSVCHEVKAKSVAKRRDIRQVGHAQVTQLSTRRCQTHLPRTKCCAHPPITKAHPPTLPFLSVGQPPPTFLPRSSPICLSLGHCYHMLDEHTPSASLIPEGSTSPIPPCLHASYPPPFPSVFSQLPLSCPCTSPIPPCLYHASMPLIRPPSLPSSRSSL